MGIVGFRLAEQEQTQNKIQCTLKESLIHCKEIHYKSNGSLTDFPFARCAKATDFVEEWMATKPLHLVSGGQ